MTQIYRINEAELLALGMSRATIASIRDLQRIAGSSSETLSLEATQGILSSITSEFRIHAGKLQQEINDLRASSLIAQRRPEQQKEPIVVQQQINVNEILNRLANIEAMVFGG